jgi:hypothetical protein
VLAAETWAWFGLCRRRATKRRARRRRSGGPWRLSEWRRGDGRLIASASHLLAHAEFLAETRHDDVRMASAAAGSASLCVGGPALRLVEAHECVEGVFARARGETRVRPRRPDAGKSSDSACAYCLCREASAISMSARTPGARR